MAPIRFGPNISYTLIFLCAGLNISILSYDGSMVNNLNIIPSYLEHFNLNHSLIGLNAAIISAGCITAGPFVSPLVDKWGRKAGLALGSLFIILGVILQASAPKVAQFVVGRFFIGIASEINGSIAPTWVMELGSPRWRGVLSNAVMITVPTTSFVVCGFILGIHDVGTDWAWRAPVLGEAVPSLICLAILPFVDESPRWLISKGRKEEALEILIRLHGQGDPNSEIVDGEFKEMCDTIQFERQQGEMNESWKGLFTPASNLRRFTIAALTNIFYQIVGGNMILAGIVEVRNTLLVNLGLLLWNAISTVIGVFTIDKFGRKASFTWGTGLMTVCFAVLSGLVYLGESTGNVNYGIGAIIVVGVFLLGASCSWMILAYTYPPEVLRYSQRAKGVAVGQTIGYAFSFLNLYTTPIAINAITWRYYAINGGWNVVILVIVIWLFVETKGRTLEEIDEIFDGTLHSDGVVIGDGRHIVIEGEEADLDRRTTNTTSDSELKRIDTGAETP